MGPLFWLFLVSYMACQAGSIDQRPTRQSGAPPQKAGSPKCTIKSGDGFKGGPLFCDSYAVTSQECLRCCKSQGAHCNTICRGVSFVMHSGGNTLIFNGNGNGSPDVCSGLGNAIRKGRDNIIQTGSHNLIDDSTGSEIDAGSHNKVISAQKSSIGAGSHNSINKGTSNSISSGSNNKMTGGERNSIGAGSNNVMQQGRDNGISAGSNNRIIGGSSNKVTAGSGNTIENSSGATITAGSGKKISNERGNGQTSSNHGNSGISNGRQPRPQSSGASKCSMSGGDIFQLAQDDQKLRCDAYKNGSLNCVRCCSTSCQKGGNKCNIICI